MSRRIFLLKTSYKELYKSQKTFHVGDSGLDLFCVKDYTLKPNERTKIDTGVQCQSISFDDNNRETYHSYFLMSRSSISNTTLMMQTGMGLIDAGYTGIIYIPIINVSSTETVYIKKGDKLCQLVNGDLSPITVKLVDLLRQTSRSSNGFGSTNVLFKSKL